MRRRRRGGREAEERDEKYYLRPALEPIVATKDFHSLQSDIFRVKKISQATRIGIDVRTAHDGDEFDSNIGGVPHLPTAPVSVSSIVRTSRRAQVHPGEIPYRGISRIGASDHEGPAKWSCSIQNNEKLVYSRINNHLNVRIVMMIRILI
jgi:hypothetical protein